jgi:hypothetical protein
MQVEGLDRVFFADSDVPLLTRVGPELLGPGCDSMVSMQNSSARMQWGARYWSVWAGTAVLTREVLADFLPFAHALFAPPYLRVLKAKAKARPFVCDMTLWYLFVVRTDAARAAAWGYRAGRYALPPVRRGLHFCDSVEAGFVHNGGFEVIEGKNGSKSAVKPVEWAKSLHFQGRFKKTFLRMMKPEN